MKKPTFHRPKGLIVASDPTDVRREYEAALKEQFIERGLENARQANDKVLERVIYAYREYGNSHPVLRDENDQPIYPDYGLGDGESDFFRLARLHEMVKKSIWAITLERGFSAGVMSTTHSETSEADLHSVYTLWGLTEDRGGAKRLTEDEILQRYRVEAGGGFLKSLGGPTLREIEVVLLPVPEYSLVLEETRTTYAIGPKPDDLRRHLLLSAQGV